MTVTTPEFSVGFVPPVRVLDTARPRRSTAAPGTPVVLTRRGRVVLATVIVLVLAVAAVVLGSSVAATNDAGHLDTTAVTVERGDTLWGIAAEANPNGDIRSTMEDIVHLNALESGSKLPVGVTLAVPVYR